MAASHGGFFVAAAVVAAVAAVVAWPARLAYLAGTAIAGTLLLVYALFRLIPPSGTTQPEPLDATGVITQVVQLAALLGCTMLGLTTARGRPLRKVQ